jgi:hypothetical protein
MTDTLGQIPFGGGTRNPFNYDKFEQINRALTTGWLTLEEITQQLNLFGDESQDSYLEGLELAVRMHIEDYLGMPIFPISYRSYYGIGSLYANPVCLDLPEVSYKDHYNTGGVVINSVKFYNSASPVTITTLASTDYTYDPTGNKVILPGGMPSDVNTVITSPLVIEYTVNPNFLQAYPVIKQAALLLLTHLYNNRSETTLSKLQNIPYGVDALLRPYKPLVM